MRNLVVLLVGLAMVTGCGKRPAPVAEPGPAPAPVVTNPPSPVPVSPSVPARLARHDAALLEAYTQLARGRYVESLAALEMARTIDPTEQVQREIDRVRLIQAQQAGAQKAITDLRAVLREGKPEEAARLASQALVLYGSTEMAEELTQLKRQADALVAAQSTEQASARADRLRLEVQTALKPEQNNLRAAVVALEQLDGLDQSPEIDQQLTTLRDRLTRYDTALQRARQLRAQPETLDDALEQYQVAAQAWDNFQVQREIEECNHALSLRKPRLAIADFEVRGEIQFPDAGKTIAEELLPSFKTHFDLVERGQLTRVLDELKLDAQVIGGNDTARKELARLARVRFLVVGSVSHLGGLAVNARAIDLETGLIVQTGRILATDGADLRRKLPELGAQLLMTDEEKLAFEARQQQEAPAPQVIQPVVVPPAPEPLPQGQPLPAPVITITVVPPAQGQVALEDLDRLPPMPAEPAPIVVVPDQEEAIRRQMLVLMVELGDNHFRRGQFDAAFRCYDLALALGGPRPELRLRVDRCRPMLPPGFVLLPPRPRIGILPFCTHGNVPPGLNCWITDALSYYLPREHAVVPRGELFWYMRRLGLSIGDVIHNPSARRWLARALGVRYFLVGSIRETASFDVTSHLLDAEYGFEVARSRVHVHDVAQLKLCLPELVRRLFLTPAERARLHAEAEAARLQAAQMERLAAEERLRQARASTNYHLLLLEARRHSAAAKFGLAIEFLVTAQKQRPDSIEVQVLLQQQREQQRRHEMNDRWRTQTQAQKTAFEEMQRKQAELTRAAEEARKKAEQDAERRAEADRRTRQAERDRAHQDLITRAQKALDQNRYDLAANLFRDAIDLKPSPIAQQGLAAARAAQDRAKQLAEAAEKARKEQALREQREKELAAIQAQIEAERQKRERQEQTLREAQITRDRQTFAKLLQEARDALAKNQVEPAMNALQTARRLRPQQGNEVDPLWNQALALQNRLALDKLEAAKRAELEKQQAAEKAAREKAEAEAATQRRKYNDLLVEARKATFDGKLDLALTRYEEAQKLYRTEEVASAIRKTREALTREQTQKTEMARLTGTLQAARLALSKKDLTEAAKLIDSAAKLAPQSGEVKKLQGELAAAQTQARLEAERAAEDAEKKRQFARVLNQARTALATRKFAEAVSLLEKAEKLNPMDREIPALLKQARAGLSQPMPPMPPMPPIPKPPADGDFQKQIGLAARLESQKKYPEAIQAFREALKLKPNDLVARIGLQRVENAQTIADNLNAGRAALRTRRWAEAEKSFNAVLKLEPRNAEARDGLQRAREKRQ